MAARPTRRSFLLAGGAVAAAVAGGAAVASSLQGAASPRPDRSSAWPSGARSLTPEQWRKDIAELDLQVRSTHPDPFVLHPEAAWRAGLGRLQRILPAVPRDRGKIALIRQVALLDTHSGVFPEEVGFRQYGIAVKEFGDGVHATGSIDGKLNGARLTAIGSMPIEHVLSAMVPLLNADNASAVHDLRPWFLVQAEILRAIGAVSDVQHPRYRFVMPDGTVRTVDVPFASPDDIFGPISDTGFTTNTPSSWRALKASEAPARVVDHAVVIGFTALDQPSSTAVRTMRSALRDGRADRVVFDMRYCRGGDYTAADSMREALAEPSVRERLTVITGSDNVSAGSSLAEWLRHNTSARFVGQTPPTITNPMLNEVTFTLPHSGVIVHVPNDRWIFDAGERLRAMPLDVTVRDQGAHFFRGVDDTLPVALRRAR